MSKISYLVECSINDGKLDEFKAKAATYIDAVKSGEPGTLVYKWWIGDDGKRCLIQESFESSEALMTHLGNVGPTLPELFAIAPATRLQVFGESSDEVRAALADFGAKHFPQFQGFER